MIFSTCQTGPGRGCTKKIRVIRHAKGKNGGHVLPLRKLRDLSKDPLRVPQVFPINVKETRCLFFPKPFGAPLVVHGFSPPLISASQPGGFWLPVDNIDQSIKNQFTTGSNGLLPDVPQIFQMVSHVRQPDYQRTMSLQRG
jgi:hypothetical protein